MNKLTIVILNYNLTDSVRECLRSLNGITADILVVDNSSPDRSIEELSREFPHVSFMFLKTNLGFSHGNNIAILSTASPYLYVLNPDTTTSGESVCELLNFLEKNPDVGLVSPLLIHTDGSSQYSYNKRLTLSYEMAEAFFFPNWSRDRLVRKNKDHVQLGMPFDVDWVAGAAMMFRRSAFDQVGGFDEDFFLMYEDIDFCDRLRDGGWRIVVVPTSRVVHEDGGIIARNFTRLVTSRYQARLVYMKKHYSLTQRILARWMHIVGLLLRLALVYAWYSNREREERRHGYYLSLLAYGGIIKFPKNGAVPTP